MPSRNSETSVSAQRASEVWKILVAIAADRQTITYGELAALVGLEWALPVRIPLDHVGQYCIEQDLPPLTALAIDRNGLSGRGFANITNGADPDAARDRVFAYDWSTIPAPIPEELAESYRARPR